MKGEEYLKIEDKNLLAKTEINREEICPVRNDKDCIIEASVLITERGNGLPPITIPLQ